MAATVARFPAVDPHADGISRVDVELLVSKLGATAWHVWTILCSFRDWHGSVHPSIGGIARARGYVRTSRRAVQKALVRLRAAGLVRDVGWQRLKVPCRGKLRERTVYVREVYGEVVQKSRRLRTWHDYEREAARSPGVEVIVPSTTKQWLADAKSWGGRRANSGRRRIAQVSKTSRENLSRGIDLGFSRGITEVIQPKREKTKQAEVSSCGRDAALRADSVSSWDETLGTLIGSHSTASPRPSLSTPLDGVPPYPGVAVVMPARIPSPPTLDPSATDREKAQRLAAAYRGALSKRTGKPSFVLSRGDIQRSRFYKLLLGGAAKLIEHELPPTSWALWSVDIWRDYGEGKQKVPPLPWVYGPKRIVERRGWFRRESHAGGRVVFGRKHIELLDRYEKMRRALHVAALTTAKVDVSEIVAEHFPTDATYERLVAEARFEAEQKRQRFEERIARGEFLWG